MPVVEYRRRDVSGGGGGESFGRHFFFSFGIAESLDALVYMCL